MWGGVNYNLPNYSCTTLSCTKEKQYVLELCNIAFQDPIMKRKTFNDLFNKWNASADFVIAYNANILGYIVIYANDAATQVAYITSIAVLPEFQNKHVGNKLLSEAQIIALNHGMKVMKLEVSIFNKKAIHFYEKNGFKKNIGRGNKSFYMSKTINTEEISEK